MKKILFLIVSLLIVAGVLVGCHKNQTPAEKPQSITQTFVMPEYRGEDYTVVNGNKPFFTEDDFKRGTVQTLGGTTTITGGTIISTTLVW